VITELWRNGSSQPVLVKLSFRRRELPPVRRWSRQEDGSVRMDPAVRMFQDEMTFYLLLPGQQTSTSPGDDSIRTRWLRREIAATVYSRPRHRKPEDEEELKRNLNWNVRKRPHENRNLVAGEKDQDILFLQLAIYAARDGLLDVDVNTEEKVFRRFESRFSQVVLRYLRKWGWTEGSSRDLHELEKDENEAEALSVLGETLLHVQKRYCLPGCVTDFATYTTNTINNVIRQRVFSARLDTQPDPLDPLVSVDRSREELSPRDAAKEIGISFRTVYDLIKKQKIPTDQGEKGQLMLRAEGLTALREWKEHQDMTDLLAQVLEKKGKKRKSALRQIERLRVRGLSDKEIAENILSRDGEPTTERRRSK
jgi:hypothetical protein